MGPLALTFTAMLIASACSSGGTSSPAAPSAEPPSAAPPSAAASASAEASPAGSPLAEVESEAKTEGTVICACPPIPAVSDWVKAEFEKAYPGITVEANPTQLPDWAARVETERNANQFLWDVYFWGPATDIYNLGNEGTFVPLKPLLLLPDVADEATWDGWDGTFLDKNHEYLMGFRAELGSISFNPAEVPPAEFDAVEDLLDPAYKGQISMADPRIGGGGQVFGAWFTNVYGEDKWRQLLADQDVLLTNDTDDRATRMVKGPQWITVPSIGEASFKPLRDAGVEFEVNLLGNDPETSFYNVAYSGLAVFDGAPHPSAATLFVNWLLSKEVQEKLSTDFFMNSRRVDVAPAIEEKRPIIGVEYYNPQTEENTDDRNAAQAIAKEIRPN